MKQGEKLLILVRRDPRSSEEIAEAMGVDKSYLPKLYKLEKLPPKPFARAVEVFGVSKEYFTSEESVLNEPEVRYHAGGISFEAEFARLQTEITALREDVSRLSKMLEHEKSINKDLSEAVLNMSKR